MDRQQIEAVRHILEEFGIGPLYMEREGDAFQVRSSNTGQHLFVAVNENTARAIVMLRELYDQCLDDIEALTGHIWNDEWGIAEQDDAYQNGFNHAIALMRRCARIHLPEPEEKNVTHIEY